MNERDPHRFDRRHFGRIGLGATAAVIGVAGGNDVDSKGYTDLLHSEYDYQRFVTEEAIRCANECGNTQIAYALGFDTSSPNKYKLVVPAIAKESHPNVPDGWNIRFAPMIASGEVPSVPLKPERPHWSREELLTPMFKGPSTQPLVALTIDDGNYNREEILQTIIDKDVSASFLITGAKMDEDPEFIKKAEKTRRITWVNHTYDHLLLDGKSASYI